MMPKKCEKRSIKSRACVPLSLAVWWQNSNKPEAGKPHLSVRDYSLYVTTIYRAAMIFVNCLLYVTYTLSERRKCNITLTFPSFTFFGKTLEIS
jgi:hypothetical protein